MVLFLFHEIQALMIFFSSISVDMLLKARVKMRKKSGSDSIFAFHHIVQTHFHFTLQPSLSSTLQFSAQHLVVHKVGLPI